MARYFVIHDTSGPNFGHRAISRTTSTATRKINNLTNFACSDGWGKAHVVVNRMRRHAGRITIFDPWRETKFEQAAEFGGALKGLFLHIETDPAAAKRARPRLAQRCAVAGSGLHAAQYDRLALLYVIASVRAGRWLIPAFHAALDADIPNGHDDPLNFNIESFAAASTRLVETLERPRSRSWQPRCCACRRRIGLTMPRQAAVDTRARIGARSVIRRGTGEGPASRWQSERCGAAGPTRRRRRMQVCRPSSAGAPDAKVAASGDRIQP